MPQKRAPFIVLEGVDDVGKSTVAADLAKFLCEAGDASEVLAFPGHDPGSIGKWVYDLHHDPARNPVNQTCLQLLHIAAHIDSIESRIKPLIEEGRGLILDRYWWSSYVYGIVGGVDVARLEKMVELEKLVWGECRPDCVVLLRRDSAERSASPALVREYESLMERSRLHGGVAEVWNDSDVRTATLEILEVVKEQQK